MSVLLNDMASGLQLAAGLNLASAVILQTHRQNMERYDEYIAYARDVVGPRVRNEDARERLACEVAALEQGLLDVRLRPLPVLIRLSALCVVSGSISTVCLFVPAFFQASTLPVGSAIALAVGSFVPVALSLLFVDRIRRNTLLRLEPMQDRVQLAIIAALK